MKRKANELDTAEKIADELARIIVGPLGGRRLCWCGLAKPRSCALCVVMAAYTKYMPENAAMLQKEYRVETLIPCDSDAY